MEFNIEKDEFVKVLQRVQGIVEKEILCPYSRTFLLNRDKVTL